MSRSRRWSMLSHLHELRDGEYVEIAAGPVVELTQPFPVRLDVPSLLG